MNRFELLLLSICKNSTVWENSFKSVSPTVRYMCYQVILFVQHMIDNHTKSSENVCLASANSQQNWVNILCMFIIIITELLITLAHMVYSTTWLKMFMTGVAMSSVTKSGIETFKLWHKISVNPMQMKPVYNRILF